MSELNNPLFDNQREFLERQKEEYKHALMGDVEQIKNQGQEIGKKVAVAGGVLLAGYLLKRAFTSDKKKVRKVTKTTKKGKDVSAGTIPLSHPIPDYDPILHVPVTDFVAEQTQTTHTQTTKTKEKTAKVKKPKSEPGLAYTFLHSNFARTMAMEGIALLVAFIAKKAADRMHSDAENNDIAAKAAPATEADPVVKSASEKHAI